MHNIVAKDKFYASIKEIIPFKSLEKLNEYFESELKESSIFNDEIINKLDKMIKGLINIKNSFIETKNYKYENESKKIIIANVIYKSFYNEKNETSIASILNMEKLILNSLIFKEDKIHFGNILNECFKSLVEIGKSCNSLINRTLVSFKKNNIQEEKLIIKSTNTNGAMDSNPIITNDEIFYNSSNLTEKINNLEDNSSFKNSKIASILSNIKDSSMSERFVSNQNNTIIELNENNYNEEKMSQSKKVKSPKTKRRKIKDKSKSNIFVIKIDNKDNKKIRKFENIQNVYINYKNNIQENKDHFVFDRKTIDELLKSSMTSLEYDNY
jgi:hypothetical protein